MKALGTSPHDLASYHFLRGFHSRLNGDIDDAFSEYKEAEKHVPRDRRRLRELATASMVLGELDEAERYARQAYSLAPSNPFVPDILASVLIKRLTRYSKVSSELENVLNQLKLFETDSSRPFYPTRMAEMHTRLGDPQSAIQTIRPVYREAGRIPDVIIVYFYAALQKGDTSTSKDLLRRLGDLVFDSKSFDRKSEFRTHAKMEIDYMIEVGDLKGAEDKIRTSTRLNDNDKDSYRRQIDFIKSEK